jgi:hypothetical protein
MGDLNDPPGREGKVMMSAATAWPLPSPFSDMVLELQLTYRHPQHTTLQYCCR